MMAVMTLEVASNALQSSRQRLVNEYVRLARTMWLSLTPADWWNDAVTYGAAARLALLELALIGQVRRLGISYADQTLRMVGVAPAGNVQQLVYPRVNTDPWLVAARPAEDYRGEAVKNPGIRPETWPKKGDELFDEVTSGCNPRCSDCRPTCGTTWNGPPPTPHWAGIAAARCSNTAGCFIRSFPVPVRAACA